MILLYKWPKPGLLKSLPKESNKSQPVLLFVSSSGLAIYQSLQQDRMLSHMMDEVLVTERAVEEYLLGREVYRRTDYLALRSHGEDAAVRAVLAS